MNERSEHTDHLAHRALLDVPDADREELAAVWKDLLVLDSALYTPDSVRLEQIRATLAHPAMNRPGWRTRPIWAAAAVIMLLCMVGLGYYGVRPVTVSTMADTTRFVNLPDGSTAELNANTSLTYQRWFLGQNRQVNLTGEAFFDVNVNEKPFVVVTQNAMVMVEGTRFNVRAWATEAMPITEVYLVEGRVRLQGKEMSILLQPGQASHVTDAEAPTPPETRNSTEALAWRTRAISFRNETLQHIFDEIGRQFAVPVSTHAISEEAVLDQRLTYIAPHPMTAATLIADVCRIAGLRYRVTSQGYQIVHPATAPAL